MSEIRATTISDAAGTGPVTLTKQHAAKAWVQANAGAIVIGSFNISSGTDAGVGDFRNGIISAMANDDDLVYVVSQRTGNINTTSTADNANITASQISTNVATASTGAALDTLYNGTVHGDLA